MSDFLYFYIDKRYVNMCYLGVLKKEFIEFLEIQ